MISLSGKVCVVTGASSGIGEAVARRLGQEGSRLVLVARSVDKLEALAEEIGGFGDRPVVTPADVSNEEQVRSAIELTIATFGGVDILVNSAGAVFFSAIGETEEQQWDQILDSNLKGTFLTCKYAVPNMLSRGRGDIVNIASVAA
ncbi:SDR family NAD(P)-dependent oxidoreductase, partial [Dehalococcoidia bacterium]|nr:SDR family NAD(P)-dependent oxidoreductase [Dehalococcoidia bacterium]